ncbi:MAG: hypothetical protein JWM86_2690 [Thermoleophilia bacterium]|nr:hypothetical protein [Thermoleophilia bacterium]
MARALCRSQDSRLADANDRLLEEHALLQSRIEQLRGALAGGDVPGAASLQGLGAELAGHVRWEERTLFQLLQGLFGDGLADLVEVTDDAS